MLNEKKEFVTNVTNVKSEMRSIKYLLYCKYFNQQRQLYLGDVRALEILFNDNKLPFNITWQTLYLI